jgi:hypothetical protein
LSDTADEPEELRSLRLLAARLRALATVEPHIAEQLEEIADAVENRADALAARQPRPRQA